MNYQMLIHDLKFIMIMRLKLKAYSKKMTDPLFGKNYNTIFKQAYGKTTLGQLNFLKWAIENGVINYIENNYQAITAI